MTKETILDEYAKYAWECDESQHVVPYSKAEKAMDEYAKQQAIAFDKWKLENYWLWDTSVLKYFKWDNDNKRQIRFSHEEIYNQFIEQQNK